MSELPKDQSSKTLIVKNMSEKKCPKCDGEKSVVMEEKHENKVRDSLPPFSFKTVTTKIRRAVECPHCDGTGLFSTYQNISLEREFAADLDSKHEKSMRSYNDDMDSAMARLMESLNGMSSKNI